ncbi:MAG: hypothetical protein H6673_14630 [Anaerolineales bacterium]|nr:hypothetical protein [Anaerolineales bacterium]
MFEPCEVDATFAPDGLPKPLSMVWAGKRLSVIEYGRTWQTDEGLFMLVRVQDGRGFQLWFSSPIWQARLENTRPTNFV